MVYQMVPSVIQHSRVAAGSMAPFFCGQAYILYKPQCLGCLFNWQDEVCPRAGEPEQVLWVTWSSMDVFSIQTPIRMFLFSILLELKISLLDVKLVF